MDNTLLSVKNVETYYDKVRVLHGVSFNLAEGTITTILGNNGAGKTTLLNTIMGLLDDQPDKGSITYDGQSIHGVNTEKIIRLGVSYVPEGRKIFDELTVKENLMVGAYTRKNRAEFSKNLERIYDYFPVLSDRQSQRGGTLSGGEQQMLAISRALMNQPTLLIMDEPSLGLSPALVKQIFDFIPVIRDQGVSILLVEQNAHMALKTADYGYIMEHGRFVHSGSASVLREDEDVKEFYLGIKADASIKGEQRYKRKRRWA